MESYWKKWEKEALEEEKEKYLAKANTLERIVGDGAGSRDKVIARKLQRKIEDKS